VTDNEGALAKAPKPFTTFEIGKLGNLGGRKTQRLFLHEKFIRG